MGDGGVLQELDSSDAAARDFGSFSDEEEVEVTARCGGGRVGEVCLFVWACRGEVKGAGPHGRAGKAAGWSAKWVTRFWHGGRGVSALGIRAG